MASQEILPEPGNPPEEVDLISPPSEALKDEICDDSDGVELGRVVLLPDFEPAVVYIYDVGIVFKLSDIQLRLRSKSFDVRRENAKSDTIPGKQIGSVDVKNRPQCVIIKWEDFVNCRIHVANGKAHKSEKLELEIISYEVFALTKKMRYKRRRRCVLQFAVVPSSNETEIQASWIDKIKIAGRRFVQRNFACIRELSDEELLAKKRVLILLNPVSGKRTGMKIFNQHVGPFLNDTDIEYELFVTERANHANERLSKEDLDQWDALLFMSGDGLLNEGVNGLLSREDAALAIQKPYGLIPCGSGNAIVGGILHYSREDFSPLSAAFVFAKGLHSACLQTMDVGMCIQDERRTYFCMLVNWGFSGDVDVETEVIRGIGELRFVFGALWRCLNRRTYRANISYLPIEEDSTTKISVIEANNTDLPEAKNGIQTVVGEKIVTSEPTANPETWIDIPGPFTNVLFSISPTLSHDLFCAPTHKFGSGYFTICNLSHANFTRMQIIQMMDLMKEDNIDNFQRVEFFRAKAFRFTPIYPPNGFLVVDGEVVPYQPCEGRITGHKMFITSLFAKEK